MEEMLKDLSSCLQQANFGGKILEAYRGIKQSDYIFCDERVDGRVKTRKSVIVCAVKNS
jgi:hypothetical protein